MPDYNDFIALFAPNNQLTLVNGMSVSTDTMQLLEQTIDEALTGLGLLPGGYAVEIPNREQVSGYVSIHSSDGVLHIPNYTLKLVTFDELVERLAPEYEAFKLYHVDRDIFGYHSYSHNLRAWRRVNGALITDFRSWLPRLYADRNHAAKLQAVLTYCRLAERSGYLTSEQLEEIVSAAEEAPRAHLKNINKGRNL